MGSEAVADALSVVARVGITAGPGLQVPAVSGLSTASRLASGRAAAAIGDAVPAGLIAGGVPELLSGPAVPA